MLKHIYIIICLIGSVCVGHSQQNLHSLSIKIEPSCSKLKGSLNLYRSMSFEVFNKKDSNFKRNLNIASDSIRIDSLERWTYMIEYSPSDKSILPSKRIIQLNTDVDIYLDCNYFNRSQQSVSSQLESGEFIVFYSPEFPNPFLNKKGNEIIDYNVLVIERKKQKYYAYYYTGIVRENMFGFGVNLNVNFPISMLEPQQQQQKELNQNEMDTVIAFERELKNRWFEMIEVYQQGTWKIASFYYIPKLGYTLLKLDKELILQLKNNIWEDN